MSRRWCSFYCAALLCLMAHRATPEEALPAPAKQLDGDQQHQPPVVQASQQQIKRGEPQQPSGLGNREADYTLDESFWIEESPAGEVERLLREYTQNQEMVRNIGSHYYQIIYPVQLRQHKKMGISTRDIASKVRNPRSTRGQNDGGGYGGRGRQTKTGKHFHRTSLLIKAFNHKFRLDLELNTQLIAPNIMQKHYLANGAEQVSKQDIEHCYYHGKVQDYPGATAAFHTCNGVSGVIHVGNETFVIHPFYGGDLSQKHPHVIFEARTKANKGCANTGNMEWRLNPASMGFLPTGTKLRLRRDVREATKYIETALVIDKAMFEKRNGSTRIDVVHDSIQVANIADLYFRTLNTRVSVVYIETWQGGNQAQIDRNLDIGNALSNFNTYTSRKLFNVDKDTTQLLTGEMFAGGEAGMAVPAMVCTPKSVGISVDINTYEPHLLAGTMAHMIGHNIGMGHDDGREECFCKDWHGCIMAKSIVGLDNVQPYKFSECSMSDYIDRLRTGNGICLLNKPNELQDRRTCGNSVVEEGEDCDCGGIDNCRKVDPCCDPITCKLTKEAQCASGPCCDSCRLKEKGYTCRDASNECDLPEQCTGESGECPIDVFKKNGSPCGKNTGYCFNGQCPTLALQCEYIWGFGEGKAADQECFEQFNSKGSINGHCGSDATGRFVKCAPENIRCGSLQCQGGNRYPVVDGLDQLYSRTIISIKGVEYECKTTTTSGEKTSDLPHLGLVRDGTPCGENLICVNQTCTSIFPHVTQEKCPSNTNIVECSGHGDCTNTNKCFCEPGFTGSDCSIQVEVTLPPAALPTPPQDVSTHNLQDHMKKKETPYGANHTSGLQTMIMVGVLVLVVMLVFVCFALMAVCYRKTTVSKYEKAYKKPSGKNYILTPSARNHSREDSLDSSVLGTSNMMTVTGGSIPSLGRTDSQRVLFRPSNHMSASGSSRYPDQKMQQFNRSDDDQGISQEEDTVSFIDLQANNFKMQEKKGILKKHDYGMLLGDGATSTERALNGYHDEVVEALRKMGVGSRGVPTPSGSTAALEEELLRLSLSQRADSSSYGDYNRGSRSRLGSKENICDQDSQLHQVTIEREEDDEDEVPPVLRIRNLDDLIRQLKHHSASRHMSPSGSEDIRMSETEADRQYRQESSSACSESSHQSNRDPRLVYGRYRQPMRMSGSFQAQSYMRERQLDVDDGIYESADHEKGAPQDLPDSESDDFIQAQQQLARWASEDGVGGLPSGMPSASGPPGGPPHREYYPSPSSSTSEEPPSIARAPMPGPSHPPQPPLPPQHPDHATIHRPKRYPEYKH